jgi:VanZ family protein
MKPGYLLPAIVWLFVIALLLSMPANNIPKTPFLNIPHFDKLVHVILFAVFVVLLNYGFYKQKSAGFYHCHYTISMLTGVLTGIGTELLQEYFALGRSGDLIDLLADIAGSIAGWVFFWFWKSFHHSFLLE